MLPSSCWGRKLFRPPSYTFNIHTFNTHTFNTPQFGKITITVFKKSSFAFFRLFFNDVVIVIPEGGHVARAGGERHSRRLCCGLHAFRVLRFFPTSGGASLAAIPRIIINCNEHRKSVVIFWKVFSGIRLPSPCSLRKYPKYEQTPNWKLLCWNNFMLKLHCVEISNVEILLCWNFQCWNYIVVKFRMITLCVEFSNVNISLCYELVLPNFWQ